MMRQIELYVDTIFQDHEAYPTKPVQIPVFEKVYKFQPPSRSTIGDEFVEVPAIPEYTLAKPIAYHGT